MKAANGCECQCMPHLRMLPAQSAWPRLGLIEACEALFPQLPTVAGRGNAKTEQNTTRETNCVWAARAHVCKPWALSTRDDEDMEERCEGLRR